MNPNGETSSLHFYACFECNRCVVAKGELKPFGLINGVNVYEISSQPSRFTYSMEHFKAGFFLIPAIKKRCSDELHLLYVDDFQYY
jgi:hypothetical protein